jgi:hypothetical protein
MSDDNPIKQFFSKDNAQYLYSYIQRGLEEKYGTRIDTKYMGELIDIMKMVIEPLPKRIPADVDRKWFVNTLNQRTLKEALPIFADIVTPAAPPAATPTERVPITPRPQSTPIKSIAGDEDEYERMQYERSTQERPLPNFEDPPQDYADDINDLYESAEQQRQYQHQQLSLVNDEAEDEQEEERGYFDPNAFQGVPPRGSERYRKDRKDRKDRQDDTHERPLSEVDFAVESGRMLSFNDIAPQPAQMRVLIPKTSRNNIPDGQHIPHWFVVNSRDRNPATYPSASEYRLELRVPFIDVVSVELIKATLPLTTFNVNANNNVIYFEEMLGDALSATIPVGNYPDATTLAISIAASMTAASANGVTYTSAVNALTDKITLVSDGAGGSIFSLLFFGQPTLEGEGTTEYRREKPQYPPNSIGPVVGFNTLDYSGALMYEAPFVPQLGGDPDAYLHVEELELLESNDTQIHNAFAVIKMDGLYYARFDEQSGTRFIKYFSPPKGKLAYLTITWRNAQGDLIDFNGAEHSFALQIITKDKTQGPYDE